MSPGQYNQMLQAGAGGQQYNPYNNMMYGNVGTQQNVMQNNQNMIQILKGRPVSGVEEARASMIDLDGSLFIFPDLANHRIYTKQINLNGEPEFKTYALREEQKPEENRTEAAPGDEYVLKSDFEEIIMMLNKKIKVLEGKKHDADVQFDGADANEK